MSFSLVEYGDVKTFRCTNEFLMWRIPANTDVNYRPKINTGGKPIFAGVEFRLSPADVPHGIALAAEWTDDTDNKWLEAIQTAIDEFVAYRISEGRPVFHTAIAMIRVTAHPIDTDANAVRYVMKTALHSLFKRHEVDTQP